MKQGNMGVATKDMGRFNSLLISQRIVCSWNHICELAYHQFISYTNYRNLSQYSRHYFNLFSVSCLLPSGNVDAKKLENEEENEQESDEEMDTDDEEELEIEDEEEQEIEEED